MKPRKQEKPADGLPNPSMSRRSEDRLQRHIGKQIEFIMNRGPSAWRGTLVSYDPRYRKAELKVTTKYGASAIVEVGLGYVMTTVFHDADGRQAEEVEGPTELQALVGLEKAREMREAWEAGEGSSIYVDPRTGKQYNIPTEGR